MVTSFPSTQTVPEYFLSAPMISLAISVLPAPTSPASPTISPSQTENVVSSLDGPVSYTHLDVYKRQS